MPSPPSPLMRISLARASCIGLKNWVLPPGRPTLGDEGRSKRVPQLPQKRCDIGICSPHVGQTRMEEDGATTGGADGAGGAGGRIAAGGAGGGRFDTEGRRAALSTGRD